jgi:hypothetical protein
MTTALTAVNPLDLPEDLATRCEEYAERSAADLRDRKDLEHRAACYRLQRMIERDREAKVEEGEGGGEWEDYEDERTD